MDFPNPNYNYYPNMAMSLAAIAYAHYSVIPDLVASLPDMTCIWVSGNTEAQMLVARNVNTNEFFVAIRGTDPISFHAWMDEDFAVNSSVPFDTLPGFDPMAPSRFPTNLPISQGGFTGMSELLALQFEGQTLLECLQNIPHIVYLYVTGHSLGGTMTPLMYTYLHYMLYGMAGTTNMALWSFAGLTGGGTIFNDYLDTITPSGLEWRIQNTLDIAPMMFASLTDIQDIYNAHCKGIDRAANDILTYLFSEAAQAGIGYSQPRNSGSMMPGTFMEYTWPDEALYQHHSTTYSRMVTSYFPYSED